MVMDEKIVTAVISQPHCYPWMGYLKLTRISDVFVVMDNVQFEKRSWQSRNRIKGPNGVVFLTVPVLSRGKYEQKIGEVLIDNTQNWRRKHLNTLEVSYRKAPHYEAVMSELRPMLEREWELLMDFTLGMLKKFCAMLKFEPRFVFASTLEIEGGKNEYLINVCRNFGATRYVSNDGSAAYLENDKFEAAGIQLDFLRYQHPEYPQLFGEFLPYMSVLDLLFNVGPDAAPEYILRG